MSIYFFMYSCISCLLFYNFVSSAVGNLVKRGSRAIFLFHHLFYFYIFIICFYILFFLILLCSSILKLLSYHSLAISLPIIGKQ